MSEALQALIANWERVGCAKAKEFEDAWIVGYRHGKKVAAKELRAALATPAPAQPDPDPKDVMIGQIHVALRLAGLMLVRTEQGLKVERTLEATAEWAKKARFNDGPTPNDPPFLFGDEPAIAAAPAQPDPLDVANERGEGWQPIETAPKDGTAVLCLSKIYNKPFHYECNWNGLEWYHGFGEAWDRLLVPTHWMPLPTPPGDVK